MPEEPRVYRVDFRGTHVFVDFVVGALLIAAHCFSRVLCCSPGNSAPDPATVLQFPTTVLQVAATFYTYLLMPPLSYAIYLLSQDQTCWLKDNARNGHTVGDRTTGFCSDAPGPTPPPLPPPPPSTVDVVVTSVGDAVVATVGEEFVRFHHRPPCIARTSLTLARELPRRTAAGTHSASGTGAGARTLCPAWFRLFRISAGVKAVFFSSIFCGRPRRSLVFLSSQTRVPLLCVQPCSYNNCLWPFGKLVRFFGKCTLLCARMQTLAPALPVRAHL
jgi:hypothetical protein